jgi:hypothetical protein
MYRIMDHLPELKSLRIGIDHAAALTAPGIQIFRNAPQLRIVELFNIRPRVIGLPWAQLQQISLFLIDWLDALRALDLCPNLTSFCCSTNRTTTTDHVVDREVHTLHTFEFILLNPRLLMNEVFNAVKLPSLKSFTLSMDVGDLPALIDEDFTILDEGEDIHLRDSPVFVFLSHSPSITNLTLDQVQFASGHLSTILSLLPNLTTLSLRERRAIVYVDLLRLLSLSDDTTALLPRLQTLEYELYGEDFGKVLIPLIDIVNSRRVTANRVPPLHYLQVRMREVKGDLEGIPGYDSLMKLGTKDCRIECWSI